MEEIDITIDEDGNVEFHIKGIKGKGCEKIEAALAEALGTKKSSKPTAEFYQKEKTRQKVTR